MKVLADTSALLALYVSDDANHARALEFARQHPRVRYVLTELILAEVATRLRALAGAERAASVTLSLLESRRYELLFADTGLLRGAIDKMGRFRDKRLSLTDCASFEVMERLGLREAFSFDRDFRDCGYPTVP
ncbi:MAG: type II toxin-antitoxin system VapC family toxin [Candidatus Rokuibacteriota bacterium]